MQAYPILLLRCMLEEEHAHDGSRRDDHSDIPCGWHICRGNNASRWIGQGGYESIAQTVLRCTHVRRLLLEYDDERVGDFSPLATVPDDTIVILGLITTQTSTMENSATIHARLRAASRYGPLERLALSPHRGFASVAIGTILRRRRRNASSRW